MKKLLVLLTLLLFLTACMSQNNLDTPLRKKREQIETPLGSDFKDMQVASLNKFVDKTNGTVLDRFIHHDKHYIIIEIEVFFLQCKVSELEFYQAYKDEPINVYIGDNGGFYLKGSLTDCDYRIKETR